MEQIKIDSYEKAAWAMRKYRVLAQRRKQFVTQANNERSRIDDWCERKTNQIDQELEFWSSHLEHFAQVQRLAGQKSLSFPDGECSTRSVKPGVDIDASTFVQWALDAKRDDLLITSYAPNRKAIEALMSEEENGMVVDVLSGEVLPGIQPRPGKVSFRIDPDMTAVDLEGIDDDVDD